MRTLSEMQEDVVISVERLSKKYVIGHQEKRERYVALRDVVARTAKRFATSAVNIARGRPIVAGDTTEEFWALKDVSFEVTTWRRHRNHRTKWRRQKYAAKNPVTNYRTKRRSRLHYGSCRQLA